MKKQTEIQESQEKQGKVKWYREKITEMISQIEDIWILEQIHKFIVNMTKEGA